MRAWFAIVCCLTLAACGGGGSTPGIPTQTPVPIPQQTPLVLAPTQFTFVFPKSTASLARGAKYLTSSIQSVTITLNSVNGGSLPTGLTGSVTTNMTPAACPCAVPGPNVPPGTDSFTLTTYDATNATGHVVSTATASYTIVAGQANSNTVSLNGVPASFAFGAMPSATAGTAFTSAQTVPLSVKDADGNVIVGTYANAVSVSDGDATGATSLSTSGSDAPPAGKILSSSDTVGLSYTGLAITAVTFTASATGATNGTGSFSPALQPIAYSGPTTSTLPEIDLYATSGTGSTGTFSASETGWTNAPYSKSLNASLAAGCSSIATVSPASGTSFTVTVATSPAVGTCNLTLSDGVGQIKTVKLTYTTSTFGVQ